MDSAGDIQQPPRVLAAFDEYLCRVRGLSEGTRRNYLRASEMFLRKMFPGGPCDLRALAVRDVVAFIDDVAARYGSRFVEGQATALRSLLRYLCMTGACDGRLIDAVPMVPHRPNRLVGHLSADRFEVLLGSLDTASPRGLRDRAMILCIARLGLRPGEVAALRLDDIDWGNAIVRIRSRKTGHGAALPLMRQVGEAVADYLRHARPQTPYREVFVLHWLRVGAPVSTSVIGRAVVRALMRAGITDAPARGANLLRHSLATSLLAGGVGLREIGDVMGHSRLETTRIYAEVDIAALAGVAMPWPAATP